jgi:excisionase family DNA binding protein
MSDKTSDLISVTEAAKRLGVIRQRVLQLIDAERLPAVKVGNQYVIKEQDLELVAERKVGRPPKKSKE